MNKQLLTCGVMLAALPFAGHAQAPAARAASAPITLRYKYTLGEVRRYQMTMDMDMTMHMAARPASMPQMPPMHTHMVMAYSQTVQSVQPDGSATLVSHITQMTTTLNGHVVFLPQTMTSADAQSFTIVMSPTGKMLSMTLPPSVQSKMPAGMDFSKIGGIAPAMLPEDAVRIGDTWGGPADMPQMFGAAMPGMPGMQSDVVSSLAGLEPGGIADIRQQIRGTVGSAASAGAAGLLKMQGQVEGDSLVKFDTNAGRIATQDGQERVSIDTMPESGTPAGAHKVGAISISMVMKTHLERMPAAP